MENKIRALYENEEFVNTLKETKTFEEAAELFKANGIDIPAEQLEAFAKDALKQDATELSEENLDDVSGGFLTYLAIAGACLVGGYVVGRIIAWIGTR